MKPGTKEITLEQVKILVSEGAWNVQEIKPENWKKLPSFMGKSDVLAVFASGDLNNHQMMHGLDVIGGTDWLRFEENPKKDEPEGNAYHFVIVEKPNQKFELQGPYTHGAFLPHHFSGQDLTPFPYHK